MNHLHKWISNRSLHVLCGLTLVLFANSLFANMGNIYLGMTLGSSALHMSGTDPIHYYNGLLTDEYVLNDNKSTNFIGSLHGGFEFNNAWLPVIAVGIGIYNSAPFSYQGHLIETAKADPAFEICNFRFNLKSNRLLCEGRLIWEMRQISPFIQLGIGPVWHRLYGYSETPLTNMSCIMLPPFTSATSIDLAYQIDIGLAYAIHFQSNKLANGRLEFGYRYVNLGSSSFGTRGSDYPYKLHMGRLESNEFYIGYIHLFPI